MNPFDLTPEEARALWVADLRSGRYKQGRGALHLTDTDEYCCLGVACETFISQGGTLGKRACGPLNVTSYGGEVLGLPERARKWLGLVDGVGGLKTKPWPKGLGASLAGCNDAGESFESIARRIEDNEVRTCERGLSYLDAMILLTKPA